MDHMTKRDLLALPKRLSWQAENNTLPAMVGLLLARPELSVVEAEILPSLLYFHHRSANYVDFYCVGYEPEANLDAVSEDRNLFRWIDSSPQEPEIVPFQKVPSVSNWYFSAMEFNLVRQQLERTSTWKYSGGVELLLLNVVNVDDESSEDGWALDFRNTLCLQLDVLKDHAVVRSISELFERIFRYCEQPAADNAVAGLSDFLGIDMVARATKKVALSLLPKESGAEFAKIASFAIRDYSR